MRRNALVLAATCALAGSAAAQSAGEAPRKPTIRPTRGAFFVAPNGNDSGPGTQEAPWKTLKKAAQSLKPGDAVYLRAGTYGEALVPQRSGEPGHYILYAAFPGETPVIDGQNAGLPAWGGPVDLKKKSYIAISGLTVRNATVSVNSTGIFAEESDHLVIEYNRTENTKASGIGLWRCSDVVVHGNEVTKAGVGGDSGGQEAVSIAITTRFEVRHNHVHDCYREGIDTKEGSSSGKVFGNRLDNLDRVALYADAWDKPTRDIEFSSNIVSNCKVGMMAGSEMGGLLQNVRYVNNVFYKCHGFAGAVDDWGGNVPKHPLKDIYVVNNTFWQNKGPFMLCNRDVEHIVVRNNIFDREILWHPQSKESAAQYAVENNLVLAAGFADPDAGDFRLLPVSKAINRGSPLDAPAVDFAGNARPAGAGFDVGAFEFGASPPKAANGGRGGETARKPPPAARKPAPPEAVAAWDAKLLARIREELQAGRKPRFRWSVTGDWADIGEIGPGEGLRIQGKDGAASVAWASLSLADRKNLATALARKEQAADCALAAFYLLAAGEEERAKPYLEKAGAASDEVTAAFK